jgi:galactose oxidase-like protein/Kelch motif protein
MTTLATPVLRPALLRGIVAVTVIGMIAVGVALFVTRPDQPAVGGPSSTPIATFGPSAPARPSAGPSAAVVAPRAATWTATGKMITPRTGHTATLLLDGRLLVVGGCCNNAGDQIKSAELYDPGSGTWASTGSMVESRFNFVYSATLLADGKVLVAPSTNGTGRPTPAQLYDPVSGKWSATGSMVAAYAGHTATRLLDGKVLVAGLNGDGDTPSAELYDPNSGAWSATGAMTTARGGTYTLLSDGKVLVAGGDQYLAPRGSPSSELYDPISGTWSATGNMITPRVGHTATLLPDGKVLVAGGYVPVAGAVADPLASAELYDPASGTWSETASMLAIRVRQTATLLRDGRVLVAGGRGSEKNIEPRLGSAELYDPATGIWSATASMLAVRVGHTATLLPDGKVLVAGDLPDDSAPFAELYDPGSGN